MLSIDFRGTSPVMGSGGHGAVSLRIRINPIKNTDPMAAIVIPWLNASSPYRPKDKITKTGTILLLGEESELSDLRILYTFENVFKLECAAFRILKETAEYKYRLLLHINNITVT